MAVSDIVLSTIIQHEGFSATPYWDRNAYRIGFGSDTWTDSSGKVHKVTKNTGALTREDAYRDLTRRVPEFQRDGIIRYVGDQAWKQLSPETQAAVTSLAYNYGSLQNLPSLRKAIQSAQPDQIAAAIKARGSDNGGINKGRRTREAAMVTPLAPVVPGPPNRGAAGTAVAAIDSTFAPGVPSVNASAYAPTVGSLSALPPTAAQPPNIPRTSATPVPPRSALPGPPAGTARAIPPVSGTPLPPGMAAPVRPSLPAVAPMVPTIKAREPWSPVEEYAVLNPPKPKADLRTAMAEKFGDATWNGADAGSVYPGLGLSAPGLTTRKVNTVPIDPMTGGLAPTGADLATALEDVAANKRRTMVLREINKGTPSSAYPTIQPSGTPGSTLAADLNPDLLSPPTGPKGRGRPTPYAPPPTIGVNKGGVPFDVASVERTKNSQPGVMPPTGYDPSMPFGYAPVPDRLTPGRPLIPAATTLPKAYTGAGGALTAKADYRPVPVPMPRPFGRMPLPPGSDGPNGYIPPADPTTKLALDVMNSPGANFAGEMNAGMHPLAAWWVKTFGPKEGRVSTARSTTPPRYGVFGERTIPVVDPSRLSPASARLVMSGGNNAWDLIRNGISTSELPRNYEHRGH